MDGKNDSQQTHLFHWIRFILVWQLIFNLFLIQNGETKPTQRFETSKG